MNRSQKTIFIIALTLLVVSVTLPVSAGLLDLPQFEDPCDVCEFARLLSEIKNIVLEVAGGITVLFIIIGGMLLSASAGIPNQITRAKQTITAAIIGLIILVCAWLIVSAVMAATLGRDIGSSWWTVTCPDDTKCKYQIPSIPGTPTTGENPPGCGNNLAQKGLAHEGQCFGPCHCSYFVFMALEEDGCTGAFNSNNYNAGSLEAWLAGHGWTQVSSPQANDVAFISGEHAGIIIDNSGASVEAGSISDDGSRPTACADHHCPGRSTNPADCPGCEDFANFRSGSCYTNQCITKSHEGWGVYYRRPPDTQSPPP